MVTRQVLDLLGEVCPVPLLRTQEAVAQLAPGAELVVETDFARAVRNITQWCARNQYPYQVQSLRGGIWRVVITRP